MIYLGEIAWWVGAGIWAGVLVFHIGHLYRHHRDCEITFAARDWAELLRCVANHPSTKPEDAARLASAAEYLETH